MRQTIRAATWHTPIRLGDIRVLTSQNELVVNDEIRRLQPKAMAVLCVLIEADGEVLTKAALIDRLWPNMMVSERVLVDAIYQLRRNLGDDARNPRYIRTIPRRGYCLVAEVSIDAKALDRRPPCAGTPHIAVTIFRSLGPDFEKCDFCEGLTEDLAHHIGCTPCLEVLPSLDNLPLSMHRLRLVSRLGATHVITGSMRRFGDRLRIVARLLDAQTGAQVWSGVYNRSSSDLLDAQNEIAKSISKEVALCLTAWSTE